MGITKQYLRYIPSSNFNIICHPDCNAVFVTLNGVSDRFVAVGACENVIIWDLRLAKLVSIAMHCYYSFFHKIKKCIFICLIGYDN